MKINFFTLFGVSVNGKIDDDELLRRREEIIKNLQLPFPLSPKQERLRHLMNSNYVKYESPHPDLSELIIERAGNLSFFVSNYKDIKNIQNIDRSAVHPFFAIFRNKWTESELLGYLSLLEISIMESIIPVDKDLLIIIAPSLLDIIYSSEIRVYPYKEESLTSINALINFLKQETHSEYVIGKDYFLTTSYNTKLGIAIEK